MRPLRYRWAVLALAAAAASGILVFLTLYAQGGNEARGSPGAGFWVDADPATPGVQTTVTRPVGENFTIRWRIDQGDTPDYQGYAGKMGFEETIVNVVSAAALGNICNSPPATCVPAGPVINNNYPDDLGQGTIFAGESRLSGTTSFAGDVYEVTLTCVGGGTSPLDLRPPPEDPFGQHTTLNPYATHPTDTFDAEVVCSDVTPTPTITPTPFTTHGNFRVDADPNAPGVQTTITRNLRQTFQVRWNIDQGSGPAYSGYQGKMAFEETILNVLGGAPLDVFCGPGQTCGDAGPVLDNSADALGQGSIFAGEAIINPVGGTTDFAGEAYSVTLKCVAEGTSPLDLRPPPVDPLGQHTSLLGGPPGSVASTSDAEVVCQAAPDTDGDGLLDTDEGPDAPHAWSVAPAGSTFKSVSGTWISDPNEADTDDDGLSDLLEILIDPINGQDPDSDGDGLCDGNVTVAGVCVAGEDLSVDGVVDPSETNPGLNDMDSDGCGDGKELSSDPLLGGKRNPRDPWDFFDVPPKDRQVDLDDVFGVLAKFGASPGNPNPNAPPYDSSYDRSAPPATYPNTGYWKTGAPDGVQDLNDVFWVLWQFGHSCFAPP